MVFRTIRMRRSRFKLLVYGCLFGALILFLYKLHSSPSYLNDLEILLNKWDKYQKETKFVEGYGNFELQSILKLELIEAYNISLLPVTFSLVEKTTERSLQKYGINSAYSDFINLNRIIPDTRFEECKHWFYPEVIQKTSIIIVFHNEPYSVLLRTIHSIINRTPKEFLYEIILMDDYSDLEESQSEESLLNLYLINYSYYEKVKFYRNGQREGLIRSKINGVNLASGEVLVFLDAHCEVNIHWLPPLLAPILQNDRTMTVPYIDKIDYFNFEYTTMCDGLGIGIFDWNLLYKDLCLSDYISNKRKHKSEPHYSPAHAGGIFAINRNYFLELGLYDPGLLIWGGENFELSFKIWQCGGNIKWVPCSRVGHIYRNPTYTYAIDNVMNITDDLIDIYNYKRVVEVWFDDEYKEYFYRKVPIARKLNIGDISKQLNLKNNLNCKNFHWYMENIGNDVFQSFPIPLEYLYWGRIKFTDSNFCLDINEEDNDPADDHDNYDNYIKPLTLNFCYNLNYDNYFKLNSNGQLTYGSNEYCIEHLNGNIIVTNCKMENNVEVWSYFAEDELIYYMDGKLCLTFDTLIYSFSLDECFGNYEPIPREVTNGPGENGLPYIFPPELQNEVQHSLNEYGINEAVSKLIALNRSIPDSRNDECKHWSYPDNLPKTSVIIVFHNEALTILRRTFNTVIYRTPEKILHEIILIDDFSDKIDLRSKLEDILQDKYYEKVKLYRNAQREGLIRSKINGVNSATGEVVVFLDAHCEVNINWLPPLLAPIVKDHHTMTVPYVDGIDYLTFQYTPIYGKNDLIKGIFEWGMLYKETTLSRNELSKRVYTSEPYYSPTHAGGLFAINRKYFLELGIYDPGLLIWGGENFELSFKIWQCGGNIKWVPCSRVGHIYRNPTYSFTASGVNTKAPIDQYNYKRVVEVWFDEQYKEYFYRRNPLTKFIDSGDITEQLKLKSNLNCKNFDWFMTNIASDLFVEYPIPPPNLYWGEIKSLANKRCLDVKYGELPRNVQLSDCIGSDGTQIFRLNSEGELLNGERCIDILDNQLKVNYCLRGKTVGYWSYDINKNMIYNKFHDKCLKLSSLQDHLVLENCNDTDYFQKFIINEVIPNLS